jgi:hypothetical protein
MRRGEAEACDDAPVAAEQLSGQLFGLGHHCEGVQDLVVDEFAHLDPPPLLGQRVKVVMQRTPAVELEHAAIRRRRAVERDLLPDSVGGRIHLLGCRAGHDEAR